ncbi:MAG TPA: transposase zinc-binding domain-containing protein [Alphaproteobacteria bacterium]|nr:transposase zinc-binding domain-containing protein [Alphaproteobacteria bacterium]
MRGDKRTLQQILPLGYAADARHHARPDHVRRAVWAILACRTARLGGHVQVCPDGHSERVWYNSCRHRLWPPCAWLQIERGRRQETARLLACEPDHVRLTRPDELRGLWLGQ